MDEIANRAALPLSNCCINHAIFPVSRTSMLRQLYMIIHARISMKDSRTSRSQFARTFQAKFPGCFLDGTLMIQAEFRSQLSGFWRRSCLAERERSHHRPPTAVRNSNRRR